MNAKWGLSGAKLAVDIVPRIVEKDEGDIKPVLMTIKGRQKPENPAKCEVTPEYIDALAIAHDHLLEGVTNMYLNGDVLHVEAQIPVVLTHVEGTFVLKDLLPWEGWPLGEPEE